MSHPEVQSMPKASRQLTAIKMGHVQTTIRKLITWAQVHDLAFSTKSRTDMSYTRSLLIRIFAILMKVA